MTVNGVFSRRPRWTRWCATSSSGARAFLADLPRGAARLVSRRRRQGAATVLRKLDNPHAHRPAVQPLARDRAPGRRWSNRCSAPACRSTSARSSSSRRKAAGRSRRTRTTSTSARPTSRAWSPPGSRSTTRRSRTAASTSATAPTWGRSTRHFAPEGEPYNLQLPAAMLDKQPMTPAPVRKGGVSFHHGNTFHQSGPNHSTALAPRLRPALRAQRRRVRHPGPALRQRPQAQDHLSAAALSSNHHDGDA